jgi:hypothetical protein
MKNSIFRDITLCSPLRVHTLFGGVYRLHLQCQIISQARDQLCIPSSFILAFLFGLFVDPEDGGDMFPRNIGLLSTYYSHIYWALGILSLKKPGREADHPPLTRAE